MQHETAVIGNRPPSLTSPTAPPTGYVVLGGRYHVAHITITLRHTAFNGRDMEDFFRELDDLRLPPPDPRWGTRELRQADETRSNKGGGISVGLPSYTARRFAPVPPGWPRALVSAPKAAPRPSRSRYARDATKRRKRSRDFARTGRRRPCKSR